MALTLTSVLRRDISFILKGFKLLQKSWITGEVTSGPDNFRPYLCSYGRNKEQLGLKYRWKEQSYWNG